MSLQDAEKRLGFEFQSIKVVSISNLIAVVGSDIFKDTEGAAVLKKMKEKIYNNIVDYIGFEGYPSESTADFNEANVSDLVFSIIGPVLSCLRRNMGIDLRLRREKEIISVDGETGGKEEFVVIDVVSLMERKYVLVAEGKTGSIGEALKQCLLSMKDMWDNNNDGEVYGFVRTGESLRVFRYNGVLFEGSRKMDVLFLGMDEWMLNYSAIVDCLVAALIK
ncbi:hypothetical protein BGX38DRAFT_1143700 [Terfezia claveryi]|nr:hypothetical protein BGX38DRAFT_1143700 [Terfezia claveryi]